MSKTKALGRVMVLVVAVWGLSLLHPTAAANRRKAVTADDPCDCIAGKALQLENAQTSQEGCEHNMDLEYESCLNDAEGTRESNFWDCWSYYDFDDWYGNWCWSQQDFAYESTSDNCITTYYGYLLPFCEDQYNNMVQQADDDYNHCFCNCPFIDESQKGGC